MNWYTLQVELEIELCRTANRVMLSHGLKVDPQVFIDRINIQRDRNHGTVQMDTRLFLGRIEVDGPETDHPATVPSTVPALNAFVQSEEAVTRMQQNRVPECVCKSGGLDGCPAYLGKGSCLSKTGENE